MGWIYLFKNKYIFTLANNAKSKNILHTKDEIKTNSEN